MIETLSPICNVIVGASFDPWLRKLAEMALVHPLWDDEEIYMNLRCAGQGDVQAMRNLSNASVYWVLTAPAAEMGDPIAVLREGLSFARLVAVKTGEREDKQKVAAILALIAVVDRSSVVAAGESLAWLELIADDGDEGAAEMLATRTSSERPEVLEWAKYHLPLVRMLFETEQ